MSIGTPSRRLQFNSYATLALIMTLFVGMLSSVASPASAATGPVSQNPANWTPQLVSANSTIKQMTQCGNTVYAVGSFTQVKIPGGPTLTRNNAFSFSATTGAITSWNPNANSRVNQVTLSADCAIAYLGGKFSTLNGTAAKYIAAVNTTSGAINPTFGRTADGEVQTVLRVGSRLFVGGYFGAINGVKRTRLASLNTTTGVPTSYLNIAISGTYQPYFTTPMVYSLEGSHDGTRLLATGVFTSVGGKARKQVFMINLGASTASVSNWYAPAFSQDCRADSHAFYAMAVAWSPDDTKIFTGTTGSVAAGILCDVAAGFSSAENPDNPPLWINHTGCDSLFSVIADDNQVYVGGHASYLDNPNCDRPGGVERQGIGAIDPVTGLATSWNPSRGLGKGADDLMLTSAGLWVSSDNYYSTYYCGGEYHPGICFFPY